MICKKDVILWFKELESYKRIDMMCTLLNMCLPFELRFLGTCLEELGRRDSQELRGIELRVNNPLDLATDMMSCQRGEPTDKKIRRKMALYLALIRACNRSCVTEIFRTLDGWGDREFYKMNDLDTLQELLLVYTMAANHPVFSFEQHLKCTDIFEKIKANRLVLDGQYSSQTLMHFQSLSEQNFPQDVRHHIPPTQHDIMSQQHTLHAIHISGQHQMQTAPIPVMSQGSMPVTFPHTHLTKIIPPDGNLQHHISLDNIPHMISSNVAIPSDLAITHPAATWTVRSNMQQYTPIASSSIELPPQSSSPMLSQQSSPASSRATSPTRSSANVGVQQSVQLHLHPSHHQVRNMPQRVGVSLKNVRRPSTETTPPPMVQTHPQISNEVVSTQNIKQMDEMVINSDGSMTQLQSLIRNGFGRSASHHRHKTGNFLAQQQHPSNQHFQTMHPGNFTVNTSLSYSMQNMTLADGGGRSHSIDSSLAAQHRNKSVGSDSGSSVGSSGEISPPETPTLANVITARGNDHVQQTFNNFNKQSNQTGGNGRAEKIVSTALGCSNSSGSIIFASAIAKPQHPPTQQQFIGSDIIIASTTGTNASSIIQSSLASNNTINNTTNSNVGTIPVPAVNTMPANNNIVNTLLISSPSNVGACGILGSVITSNSVIQQHPYNASYPYHVAAAQHMASTVRPPIIPHNPSMGPPPPGSFRLPAFQLPPNGDVIYPAYHPAGIAYLSSGGPPGTSSVVFKSSNSSIINQPTSNSQGNSIPQQSLQMTTAPNSVHRSASPYTSLTIGITKPLSCYNCGSQTHNGRDCQEASMDDVTRSAIYKLDYSVSSSNVPPASGLHPQSNSSSISIVNNSGQSGMGLDNTNHKIQQKQHITSHIDIGITTSTTTTPSTMAP